MQDKLILSNLGHTWIIDIDGTIVKHNGYLIDGKDSLLPGVKSFISSIPKDDTVIFLTSRKKDCKIMTEKFLDENQIRFDHIIYDMPYGERILVNDMKPLGLKTSIAVNLIRDAGIHKNIWIDESI